MSRQPLNWIKINLIHLFLFIGKILVEGVCGGGLKFSLFSSQRMGVPKLAFILISAFFINLNVAWGIDESSLYQFHLRMGMFNGSYAGSGVEARGWSVPTTIDAELEVFLTRDKSFNLTATMAMELDTNKVNYTYAGVGQTYYLLSRGRKDVKSEKLVQIKTVPKTRYYWGWNVGIAQVLAIDYGLILGTYSTTLDISGNAGMIYQIGENMGIEFRGGMGMGYGFSTVTVTGTTMRALIGLTYFLR